MNMKQIALLEVPENAVLVVKANKKLTESNFNLLKKMIESQNEGNKVQVVLLPFSADLEGMQLIEVQTIDPEKLEKEDPEKADPELEKEDPEKVDPELEKEDPEKVDPELEKEEKKKTTQKKKTTPKKK